MKKFLRFLSYVLVAALASCVTMFACAGKSKLETVEQLITRRYIGEVNTTALEDAAASAMVLATGDRWSYYVSAAEYQSLLDQKNNSYVGIGITISVREDGTGFDILSVTQGGPAQDVGLSAGDVLTHVEGQKVTQLGLTAAKDLIRGEEGTHVEVTVEREGESLIFSVERRNILTPVVTWSLLGDGIGLIKIANFNHRSDTESIAAIEALREQGAEKLIFDVRDNPGGFKNLMVNLLDYLLPEGPLFRSEDYSGRESVDESDAAFLDMPMAVLVNGSSYSAAEFFAAALREYDAAVVVGENTTGKGHFQQTFELADGSAVNLSVGRYTTPKGVNLDGVGITPDVLVEVDAGTAAQIYAGTLAPEEDPQLQAAVQALKNP